MASDAHVFSQSDSSLTETQLSTEMNMLDLPNNESICVLLVLLDVLMCHTECVLGMKLFCVKVNYDIGEEICLK